jgi:hypothetical protein
MKNLPVYVQSAKYAMDHGEVETWRESYQANMACKRALEGTEELSAVRAYNNYKIREFVDGIINEFGIERPLYIIARTIQFKDYDGRFSGKLKDWASEYSFPDMHSDHDHSWNYISDVHPCALNEIAKELIKRQAEQAQIQENENVAEVNDEEEMEL